MNWHIVAIETALTLVSAHGASPLMRVDRCNVMRGDRQSCQVKCASRLSRLSLLFFTINGDERVRASLPTSRGTDGKTEAGWRSGARRDAGGVLRVLFFS